MDEHRIAGMDAYDVRREAERIIAEDRVPTDFLVELISQYGDLDDAEREQLEKVSVIAEEDSAFWAPLRLAGVARAEVEYHGSGDEGWVDSIRLLDADGEEVAADMSGQIYQPSGPLISPVYGRAEKVIDDFHAGYENNEGGGGRLVFDVAARTITLDHYDTVENDEYVPTVVILADGTHQEVPSPAEQDAECLRDPGGDLQPLHNALAVFVTNPAIREFLDAHDPKAVEQARAALGLTQEEVA